MVIGGHRENRALWGFFFKDNALKMTECRHARQKNLTTKKCRSFWSFNCSSFCIFVWGQRFPPDSSIIRCFSTASGSHLPLLRWFRPSNCFPKQVGKCRKGGACSYAHGEVAWLYCTSHSPRNEEIRGCFEIMLQFFTVRNGMGYHGARPRTSTWR